MEPVLTFENHPQWRESRWFGFTINDTQYVSNGHWFLPIGAFPRVPAEMVLAFRALGDWRWDIKSGPVHQPKSEDLNWFKRQPHSLRETDITFETSHDRGLALIGDHPDTICAIVSLRYWRFVREHIDSQHVATAEDHLHPVVFVRDEKPLAALMPMNPTHWFPASDLRAVLRAAEDTYSLRQAPRSQS